MDRHSTKTLSPIPRPGIGIDLFISDSALFPFNGVKAGVKGGARNARSTWGNFWRNAELSFRRNESREQRKREKALRFVETHVSRRRDGLGLRSARMGRATVYFAFSAIRYARICPPLFPPRVVAEKEEKSQFVLAE